MEKDRDGNVIAGCYRDGNNWVVPVCPFCRRRHLHGYANGVAGHRWTHCIGEYPEKERGYVLVPIQG